MFDRADALLVLSVALAAFVMVIFLAATAGLAVNVFKLAGGF